MVYDHIKRVYRLLITSSEGPLSFSLSLYIYIYIDVVQRRLRSLPASRVRRASGLPIDPGSTSSDEARPTQPRRAPARLDRASLGELRRGSIDPASTSPGEARSRQPRRAPARLGRASLNELLRGSIVLASTSFVEARSSGLRRPLMTLDRQGFDGPRCSKTFSLSIVSSSFVFNVLAASTAPYMYKLMNG